MFCGRCGTQIEDGMNFCTNCGNRVVVEAAPAVTPVVEPAPIVEPAPAPAVTPVVAPTPVPVVPASKPVSKDNTKPADGKYSKRALWSLILGVVGLFTSCFCLGVIPAIASIVLAVIDINEQKKTNAMTIIGLICSGISFLMSIVVVVYVCLA